MRFFAAASALASLMAVHAPAFASQKCNSSARLPYGNFVSSYHDHDRVTPAASGLSQRFTAYSFMVDEGDDDTGDGVADYRVNPIFVAYELRGVAPGPTRNYDEPATSIDGPSSWSASPALVPMLEEIPGVSQERIDNSYDGIGSIWNRGHLTMNEHAQRIGFEAACNTHNFRSWAADESSGSVVRRSTA